MPGDSSLKEQYAQARIHHWDGVARRLGRWTGLGGYYHRRMARVYRFVVPPGQKVLELGCATGDLLAALRPSTGVGVDFSPEMIARAKERHPELQFVCCDAHEPALVGGPFDFIILSDLVNDLWDVQSVFEQIARLSHPRTRIILNSYSRVWELPLNLAPWLKLAQPKLAQNWFSVEDLYNLLQLSGFEPMRHWEEVLWPVWTPLLDAFCNRFLVRLWPFREFALTNFLIARPSPASGHRVIEPSSELTAAASCSFTRSPDHPMAEPVVSVIVPARNEAGNIPAIFQRTPEMGGGTELVFVEGGSSDHTYEAIEKARRENPHRRCKLLKQTGAGKGDAVRLGFAEASGEVLMILDADLTVPPEDLPRFYEALRSGKGEFINGVRLVYPMESQAMRFLNLVANKFFSLAFSWLLGQSVKDTLCGTKVLWKKEYERIVANRAYFGDFDPFGDFDLIFGAARLNLRIVDLPIRYRERTYGTTNIQRWKHGWLLLRMVAFAARRIKFI
jgi:ubiquinone/menaquinone biosynthesis C-methylase UbiE